MRIFAILAVLGIFGMLIMSGCCGATGNVAQTGSQETAVNPPAPAKQVTESSQAESQQPAKEAPKNIENGEIGKTYTVNYLGSKYEVTLQKAEFAKSTNPYADGNYLMAFFEIKNIGESSEYFTPDIYAIGKDSEKYDNTFAVGLSDEYSKTLDWIKKLPPNTKMSGWAAIEVPEGTDDIDLYFEYTNIWLSDKPQFIKYRISGS